MRNDGSVFSAGNRAIRRASALVQRRLARRAARRRRQPMRGLTIRMAMGSALLTAITSLGPRILGPGAASAASFQVTNLNDAGAGSLREAIIAANGTAGPDVITFAPGVTGTIALSTGQLTITDSLQIVGPGRAALKVDGGAASRVFDIPLSPGDVTVAISGLTISNGNAQNGGGLRVQDETLSLDDVALTGNTAIASGGGLFADGFAMTLSVRNSTISGNIARVGGGVYSEDTKGVTTFENVVVDGNTAAEKGGGLFFYDPDNDVVINNATITNNTAKKGGGIYLYSQDTGSFTISNSSISGNNATTGGGVYLYDIDHPVSITNSTISGNTATNGAGINIDRISAAAVISNSTISGNIATGAGGGVRLARGGGLTIKHSTITANSAANAGGARFPGPVSFSHVIVAGNTAATTSDLHAAGGVTTDFSIIGTMIGAVTDGGGNQTGVTDPQLAPLANNGGPTLTHLPLPSSPAIDAGNPAVSAPATDQRGLPRTVDAIDIGAVEFQKIPPQVTTNPIDAIANGATVTFTAAATGSPTPTVQWQVSLDAGSSFNNIPGATTTTLTVAITPANNGNMYRAVFTNSAGTTTTAAATVVSPPTTTTTTTTTVVAPFLQVVVPPPTFAPTTVPTTTTSTTLPPPPTTTEAPVTTSAPATASAPPTTTLPLTAAPAVTPAPATPIEGNPDFTG